MASSSSSASQPWKYDVFLNFRGEDTRRDFTRHLCAALRRKALLTFFDDDDLKRGEEISVSLLKVIQDSTVAILVFSKNYASSTWCLDELVKVIECHQTHGQIVIPVFYEVDPSHLRKQSGDVAAAFVKHEQNPMNARKIPRWRDALTIAANLSGFDSKEFRNDHLLINKIIEDILEKLNQSKPFDDFEHLVGMDSRIKEIKKVLINIPSEIRILGIWGMGGIGKTTTATVIYQMLSRQFEGCCFLDNVRQAVEASGINKLWEELILKVLGEKDPVKYTFSDLYLKERLRSKRVLIVLDDVNNPRQIESLIGDPCWFGPGSMILITSRNLRVFEGRADFIYEVEQLNNYEALQLFSKRAFKQNYPRDDFAALSKSIVVYAQGNPLVLTVLGSALNGKNQEEWKSALAQLLKAQNDIQQMLQIGKDISKKLNKSLPWHDFEHLVGMDSRIKEIEVFTISPFKTCVLGIWGMGGIGKTTIAEVIYKMMSCQFQDCCFVYNVRQRAEASGINKLREELILKVLGEKDLVKYTFNASPDQFLKRRLGCKKVLIVLDDVNDPRQIDSLIGDLCWLGSGSRILITGRDKQVFEGRVDFIYEVEPLNYDEALQLFNKRVFKQNYPRDDYASLSKSVVEYVQGNPLALKVLGSTLNGKNHEEWESTLTQLLKVQNEHIQQVLQISYNLYESVSGGDQMLVMENTETK